jgi:2-polyprenyl-6-methoxyphenol hydroxylase-like FAD-dependent oxidoreductase
MSSHLNILISGSGIAGSVFAFWLLRADPTATITIVERDPSLRLTGASVDIRSSAVDIIKWMGAEQDIRAQTTKEEGIQFVHGNGAPIATIKASGRTDIQTITSEFEIFRGALAKIFVDRILDRVKFIYGETIDRYEQQDDSVMVTFTESKEVKKFDLLIAADGLGSKIRGLMLDVHPRKQVHDEGVHVAYFTIKKDLLQGSRMAKWHNDTQGRCVFLRPDPHPEGRTRGNLMIVTTKADVKTKERLNAALIEGNEVYMSLMEELFGDVGWCTPEVLQGMRSSDDFYCSLFGQIRLPKLYDGRVVLLGDAAYATPGFGTSLAIIGGYVLAGELMNHADDVGAALKAYENLLLPFAKSQQGGGDQAMQYMNPQTRWGIGIRNLIMSCVTGLMLDRLAISAMAALGFTEKKLDMPEYRWPAENA